jgi:hypothetical protein
MSATVGTGQGLVVMINANDDSRMIPRISSFVARKYHWPAVAFEPPVASAGRADPALLRALSGRYELSNNAMVTLVPCDGQLCTSAGGYPDEELRWLGDGRFASAERKLTVVPVRDSSGTITGLTWTNATQSRVIARVGPLVTDLPPHGDGPAGMSDKVMDVLRALAQGGQAVASQPALTAGARRDFSRGGGWPPAAGVRTVRFLGAEDVSRRNLKRHDGMVDRILYYAMTGKGAERTLLVYVTKDGSVTDVDDVDDR